MEKQKRTDIILALLSQHTIYTEPFVGSTAIFFTKEPVGMETLNDTNEALINFYRVVKNDFQALNKKVKDTPCSRRLYHTAWVIYKYYDLQIFKPIDYALAFYTLATQGCSWFISSRDHLNAFHYCDPPYYSANMGRYSKRRETK